MRAYDFISGRDVEFTKEEFRIAWDSLGETRLGEKFQVVWKAIELQHKTHEEKKMIKSEIRRSEEFVAPSYPCFMESDKYIVLFQEEGQGMVAHVKMDVPRDAYSFRVGDYINSWAYGDFKPFKGEVVLTSD